MKYSQFAEKKTRDGFDLRLSDPPAIAKRLELLHQLVPTAKIMALLVDPTDVVSEKTTRGVQAAATSLRTELHVLSVTAERELDAVFQNLIQLHQVDWLLAEANFSIAGASSSPRWLCNIKCQRFSPIASSLRNGGLMGYGTSLADAYRLAGALRRPGYQGREARGSTGPAGN